MNNTYPSTTINAISDFLFIGSDEEMLEPSDLVIVLGNDYIEQSVEVVSRLYNKGVIKKDAKMILTGATGSLNAGGAKECDQLYECATGKYHIPAELFIKEEQATNACQNFEYSKTIIQNIGGFGQYKKILCIGKDFLMRRASMYAAKFEYPAEKMQYYGIVDKQGLNIGKMTWWETEEAKKRVLAELERIGKYGLSGDLSIY